MDVIEQKYITVHLTTKEIYALRFAQSVTDNFLKVLKEKGIKYQDYVEILKKTQEVNTKNINAILLKSDGNSIQLNS